jgi:hypothetical protein
MRGSRNGYTSSIMAVRTRPAGSPVEWAPSEGKGAILLEGANPARPGMEQRKS